MRQRPNATPLIPFNVTRYLTDEAAIAEYMSAVVETSSEELLIVALDDVAHARRRLMFAAGTVVLPNKQQR